MQERELLYLIRGAIFDTYNYLGAGGLEKLYEDALVHFLRKKGLKVDRQVEIPIIIEDEVMETHLRLDIVVEDKIIIELKSVLEMKEVFHLQIVSYLKLANVHRGILVNFNTSDINSSIWYKINSKAPEDNIVHPANR